MLDLENIIWRYYLASARISVVDLHSKRCCDTRLFIGLDDFMKESYVKIK